MIDGLTRHPGATLLCMGVPSISLMFIFFVPLWFQPDLFWRLARWPQRDQSGHSRIRQHSGEYTGPADRLTPNSEVPLYSDKG